MRADPGGEGADGHGFARAASAGTPASTVRSSRVPSQRRFSHGPVKGGFP